MKNQTMVLLGVLVFLCGQARADMIEIKGRGILNGKILSQDEKGVRFKDSSGNELAVPKADVLFLEAQKDAPPSPKANGPKGVGGFDSAELQKWRYKFLHWVDEGRYQMRKLTEKARNFASKPLDRSDADAKAKQVADTLDEATHQVRRIAAKQKKVHTALRGVSSVAGQQSAGIVRHPDYQVRKDMELGDD